MVRAIDPPNLPPSQWLCCQLGAREHYAIPRALLRVDMLGCLVTDAWVPRSSLLAKICGRRSNLAERFHDELRGTRVRAFNSSLILFEMLARARGLSGWTNIVARNRWFQRKVVSFLSSQPSTLDSQPILLSYSYTALEPFRYAKANGWKTVLVQIDPGPEEEKIVAEEIARVLEAARILRDEPVEFWMVGPVEIANAGTIGDTGRVKWFGPVTRKQSADFYKSADVFILPTLSDGFAITQLEAQAHGLPLIVSRSCGEVVQHNVNGLLLDDPSAEAIESAIRFCLQNPNELARFSRRSTVGEDYSVALLGERLFAVAPITQSVSL